MADILTSSYNPAEMQSTIYEDVEGVIQNITPHKTPFIASIGRVDVDNILHEWLEDELKKPSGDNRVVEGADAEATERQVPQRLSNYTQIIDDTFKVSGTQDKVNTIGRTKTSTYQLEKSLKYLNTELEYQALNNSTKDGGDAATERKMMGLDGFVTTNDFSLTPDPANVLSEEILMDMSPAIFESCEDDAHILLVSSATAKVIAGWDQNSRITVNTNASEKKLIMAVMVLETPFGTIRIVLERYITLNIDSGNYYDGAYLYEASKQKIGWLRNWKTDKLAKTGDAQKYQTVGEMTFVTHSEKAAAKCKGLYVKPVS